jgi:hypothetical protein
VFPKQYVKPVFRKEELEKLNSTNELNANSYLSFKPAFTNENSSEFYDPLVTYVYIFSIISLLEFLCLNF